jgi:serine-type D-Ala-D-Ala carboxypeptidase (penicillin-binding protein 5/6)
MFKKAVLFPFILMWLLMSTNISVLALTPQAIGIGAASGIAVPEISAPSAILVEAESGQVLYSKNIDQPLHISAACKLMTTLIACENADFYSYVTVSSESVDAEGSALSLEVGAKYELGDLLYGIMLTSANDAAKAVAEHTAGDIGKFVEMMNDTAANLKMTGTHFTNPTGLYDENQYTTAEDISLLIKYAISNPNFNKAFSIKARPWYNSDNTTNILTSPNKLFWSYDGVEGGKTGFNKKEQQTVITTAFRENMRLISIVLDSPEKDLFTSAAALFDYGFNNFRKSTLVSKGDVLKTVALDGNEINLISQNDISYIHPLGESYIKTFTATADLKTPVRKAVPVGSASYVLQDGTTVNVSLYPETEVIPPEDFFSTARKKMLENKDILVMVLFLASLEVILIMINLFKLVKKLINHISNRGRRQA